MSDRSCGQLLTARYEHLLTSSTGEWVLMFFPRPIAACCDAHPASRRAYAAASTPGSAAAAAGA